MFCPNCGTQNDDNGVKCQKCGFNLKGAAAPKFKGTMLMMNSPMAAAPRPMPQAGGAPGQAPWPKSIAKATMIGVAPPSPGAIAPPAPIAPKSTSPALASGALLPATPPPTGSAAPIPKPVQTASPAPATAAPVNPFGGTMLMGATPLAAPAAVPPQVAPAAESSDQPVADRTVTSEGAPPATAAVAAKLESTTPSVSPPEQLAQQVPTQNGMPAIVTADTTPAPPNPSGDAKDAAFPKSDWGIEAVGAGGLPARPAVGVAPVPTTQSSSAKVRSIGLVVALGIITIGIYWLIALWGALNDFKSIRQKNDVTPILFFVPILGLIELIKLPSKVEETRTATGVTNPVSPNVVLYILFPQIFFIADLNEIVQAAANRKSLA